MIDTLLHLFSFFVEVAILVAAILIVIAGIFSLSNKGKSKTGKLQVKKLNEHYDEIASTLRNKLLTKKTLKAIKKTQKQTKKKAHKAPLTKNIFILDFQGDIRAKAVSSLREMISAVLLTALPEDEVVLRLESPGGMMHGYGLAASQLQRLRDANISLTIIIDKVAASGGYMMACVAHKIIAAPFAIIGSIGVIAQLPNFHRLLKENHIDFEQITAGQYKRTLTLFGENTPADREKMQQDIDEAHHLFKHFVQQHRPTLDIAKVATGEHWFAIDALTLGLVDELKTSDDYLMNLRYQANLLEISFQEPKTLSQKLFSSAQLGLEKLYHLLLQRGY